MPEFLFQKRRVKYKRLPQNIDVAKGIQPYDSDNKYPQRFKELSYRSPLAKQAIETYAGFMAGDGWENTGAGETVANDEGYTFNDLLEFATSDYALFKGLSLHFNFNGIGQVVEVNFLPFEYVRFGLPNPMGKHKNVKVSNNWEEEALKNKLDSLPDPVTYPLFNPLTAQAEVLTGGGGQVLYYTPVPDMYPLSSIDAIAERVQNDAEIQSFELNNTANGFHGGTVMLYPGTFDSEEEEAALVNKVGELTGSDGPGVMIIAGDEDMDLEKMIKNIAGNNLDTLHSQTNIHVRDGILQNFAQPPALAGVVPASGVFTQAMIQDSYVYYNLKTRKDRNILARIFKSFGELWHEGPLDFGSIKEREFETPVFKQEVVQPAEEEEPTEEQEREQEISAIYGYNRYPISS